MDRQGRRGGAAREDKERDGADPHAEDTRWWHDPIAGSAHVVLLRGRLQSAMAVRGADDRTLERLREAFPEAWHIPVLDILPAALKTTKEGRKPLAA